MSSASKNGGVPGINARHVVDGGVRCLLCVALAYCVETGDSACGHRHSWLPNRRWPAHISRLQLGCIVLHLPVVVLPVHLLLHHPHLACGLCSRSSSPPQSHWWSCSCSHCVRHAFALLCAQPHEWRAPRDVLASVRPRRAEGRKGSTEELR